MQSRLLFLLPLLALAGIGAFFGWALLSERDPEDIGSPLVGRAAPMIDLAPLDDGKPRLVLAELKGKPVVLNFFASWCVPCKVEHPLFLRLARTDAFVVVGVNYKDKPADARGWLAQLGDPYARIGVDSGRAGVEFGISGVPETFVIDARGVVRYHRRGVLSERDLNRRVLPLLQELAK
jgi:cytochrome c biogenesis protein CcmG/thiol:disulfide interchange protein DsbE